MEIFLGKFYKRKNSGKKPGKKYLEKLVQNKKKRKVIPKKEELFWKIGIEKKKKISKRTQKKKKKIKKTKEKKE